MPSQTFFNLPAPKRQLIIEAAVEEFENHSYESASISGIVGRAKIAKGSFYQYFKDKKDLYLYLVDWAQEIRKSFLNEANLPEVEDGFFVYLRALMQAMLTFQLEYPALAHILFRGPIHGDIPFRQEVFERTHKASISFIRQRIQTGIEQGNFSATINPDVAAFTISTLGYELRRFIPVYLGMEVVQIEKDGLAAHRAAIEEILDDVVRILEKGIGGLP